ncbi:MAG: STAS/SEC14 domain-containing protein [Nocardioidaceae bacterium]|nr:STAS/SEC14 domain-containing protein [Nocardioidaceae bacterium]
MEAAPDDAQALYRVYWDEAAEVIRCVWAPGVVCGEKEARASTEAIEALGRGAVPLLVDMRNMKKLERGARERYKTSKGGVSAMALLVGSPVTQVLANFFIDTDPDTTQTRMFTDESAALGWLRGQGR